MNRAPIRNAILNWNEDGTPVSRQFDDVYFSTQDGLEETRFVFLQGNGLPDRFEQHPRAAFIVAETGFGTGLNFLALWQAFAQFIRRRPGARLRRLHFISIEQFPLRVEDMAQAQARWPELGDYAAELRRIWPLPTPGCHRLILAGGAVTLDLWYGEINALLPQLDDSLSGRVDAWFLDGFAPARNPDMWSTGLFNAMARLAAAQGTFATFTAAGFVRRGLQRAGFIAGKHAGFGRKREMLAGSLAAPVAAGTHAPWYARRGADNPGEVAIIGGGIAGALAAEALLRRGARVTLYCADSAPAQGASGNRQGALYPLLNNEDDELAQFFANAFPYAHHYYRERARQGIDFEHQWCGVTQLAYDDRSRRKLRQILATGWPAQLIRAVACEEMPALTGLATGSGGVTYPLGGWLNPAQFTAGIIARAQSQGMAARYGHEVRGLNAGAQGWELDFGAGRHARHDTVVLATGHRMLQWPITAPLPLTSVRGQVSHIPDQPSLRTLKQVLCYDGYLTPASPGFQTHCLGASARRDDEDIHYRPGEQRANRDRLIACLPGQSWAQSVDVSGGQARCSVRSSARDHLPMIGGVPDFDATLRAYRDLPRLREAGEPAADAPVHANLFMLGGLGSRGLCTAPLAAEILAGQIFGEPLPLSLAQSAALSPNRFWLRKLLRGREI
ncbi:bifunctional tRNA (5-methylaminomethyl-2-thiouridine)(34)-methyltransferase MnmD/FAD-dependent 5-carboxymethylaminomethyl-2-thiouridine(34) oxidoreductase MnmC [Acerihabitans arboris]|uniref:tRNA 5-methylaminomethyl-2-thiouridine biosynthesis bifunctional protein MnmC n=1 Tax=Acerihabitans arboris TaxID=2691583 RepID=A0A845SR25_9GAMM|nr:bifunctional tRNA (5-methylaminomethyl-2-thiouridine)(34)-methyltransferase MnmD/FAD-dependent 5-carboxymethylaminomethyl-2-thiouridine(34) oxidoreductase MnmC [Acerihabitans arboris]NDL65326.1 bifunctional tRNA (5-methylaminomethyl-2-thiouridine)(34)-methyltransferase MnmD/FAD-dependent 5-carboxymethylaminomethyl-2-thiouridine(34) oxidoreductase MnmC [Acerihabitans arboris]